MNKLRLSPALLALLPPERLLALPPVLRARDELRALGWALLTVHDALGRLDEDERARGRQAYLSALAWNLPRLDALDRLLEATHAAGIELVTLKGGAMARTHYGDPGARPMVDVDVLCEPAQLDGALEAARGAAFEVVQGPAFRRDRDATHDVKLRDGPVVIELHHRLWHELELRSDAALLTGRALPVEADGARMTVPAAADHLFYVMVHAATHGFAGNPLWLIDSLLLAGDTTWADATAAAQAAGARLPFAAARDHLATVFPERVPLGGGPAPLRRALLRQLAPWLQRGEPELGLLPSRIVRPLLLDGPRAFVRWAAEKAAMFRRSGGEEDW